MARTNRWFQEDIEKIIELRGQGKSCKEIAHIFGSTEKSISVITHRFRSGKVWPHRKKAAPIWDRRKLINMLIDMDIDKQNKLKLLEVVLS